MTRAALCVIALAGCAKPWDGPPCEPGPEPTLEIGKGYERYEAMDEGGYRTELIHGPQGGYHIHVGVQATFLDASTPWPTVMKGFLDDVERARAELELEMVCDDEAGALQSWGTYLIWYDSTPEELDGRDVRLEVTVTDAAATTLDAVTTVPIWDPSLDGE